jgi:hypothetical protein
LFLELGELDRGRVEVAFKVLKMSTAEMGSTINGSVDKLVVFDFGEIRQG